VTITDETTETLTEPAEGETPPDAEQILEHLPECTAEGCGEGCPVAAAVAFINQQQMDRALHPLRTAEGWLNETLQIAVGKVQGPGGQRALNFSDRIALTQAAALVALASATERQVSLMAAQFGLQQQQVALLAQATAPAGPSKPPDAADALLVPGHVAAARAAAR